MDHRTIHRLERATSAERAVKVALPVPVRYLVYLMEQLALVLRVVRNVVAADSELIASIARTAQIEVGVVHTADVARDLLQRQVNLLLVANQVFSQVINF